MFKKLKNVSYSFLTKEMIDRTISSYLQDQRDDLYTIKHLLDEHSSFQISIDTMFSGEMSPEITISKEETSSFEKAENAIFTTLNWEDLQVGCDSEIEDIIKQLYYTQGHSATNKWIYDLALSNSSDVLFLCSLLHALSHIDYEDIYPYGSMFALAQLNHKDKRVVGYAIKAFSNWNNKDSLKYLNNYKPTPVWAQKELNRVIDYIKINGDDINVIFDENDYTTKLDTDTAGSTRDGRYKC